jgi:hypothetical protein
MNTESEAHILVEPIIVNESFEYLASTRTFSLVPWPYELFVVS